MEEIRSITFDSNIFISQIKGDETYSSECEELISRIGTEFYLVEPAIIFTEVGNAVGRNVGLRIAEEQVHELIRLINIIIPCDREFCVKTDLTGAGYDIY